MQDDLGALAGGAHEATEGLIHFLDTGDLINALKGGFARVAGKRVQAGFLDGVDLGQGGADDHGVADASAQRVDTFGKTAAEHQKERVGENEGFVHPGGLRGEIGEPGLERDAQVWVTLAESGLNGFSVGVAGEKDGHRAPRGGMTNDQ